MNKSTSTLLIAAVAGIMVAGALAVALPSVAFASRPKPQIGGGKGGLAEAGGAGGVGGNGGTNNGGTLNRAFGQRANGGDANGGDGGNANGGDAQACHIQSAAHTHNQAN